MSLACCHIHGDTTKNGHRKPEHPLLIVQRSSGTLQLQLRHGGPAHHKQRDLRRRIQRIIRRRLKPPLTITGSFSEPNRVMIAFDGGAVTRRGVEFVAASPLCKGLPVHRLMSGKEGREAPRQHEWGRKALDAAGFDGSASLVPRDAERAIVRSTQDKGLDIVVAGAYGHSPLRSIFSGSQTRDLLRPARIPTLPPR